MSDIALSPTFSPKTANFHLANYLSQRLIKAPHGNYLLCLPQTLLQEITLLTFSEFLAPEAETKTPEQFAQSMLKNILNLFYQYSGVSVRIHQGANGCLYLGPENVMLEFKDSIQADSTNGVNADSSEFDHFADQPEGKERSH